MLYLKKSTKDVLLRHRKTTYSPVKGIVMRPLITPPALPYPPRYIIDPVAFFIALIGGPLLFTLVSFWMLFIPVFALGFGAPAYLIIGTPVLLWYLRGHDGAPEELAALGFIVMAIAAAAVPLISAVTKDDDLFGGGLFYAGFGMIFAPAWAYCFGLIYQKMRRDFFAKPRNL